MHCSRLRFVWMPLCLLLSNLFSITGCFSSLDINKSKLQINWNNFFTCGSSRKIKPAYPNSHFRAYRYYFTHRSLRVEAHLATID